MVRRFAALLGAGAVALGAAAPAAAEETGYRYWSFWTVDGESGEWGYATQGPGTLRPADGAALGFRFAVSQEASDVHTPRAAPDFDTVCAGTEAGDGSRRVALVIDFGTAGHAPTGEAPPSGVRTECAVIADHATAGEALAATAAPLRFDSSGLLCAIAGYPTRGCAEQVALDDAGSDADATPPPAPATREAREQEDGDGGGAAVWAGVAVVLALALAASAKARRRRA